MKVYFIIILFILFNVSVLNAGEIKGNFELGNTLTDREAFVRIIIGYDFNIWEVGNYFYGGWETWMILPEQGIIMESVLFDIYTIGYKISFREIYLKIEHSCKHIYEEDYWRDEYSQTEVIFGVNF